MYAQIAPKETSFVNGLPSKLDWIVYESASLQGQLTLTTSDFDARKRGKLEPQVETFQSQNKVIKLVMEVKKVLHQSQMAISYDGENFELRERLVDFTSSCQVMIYPKFMFVNKTSM